MKKKILIVISIIVCISLFLILYGVNNKKIDSFYIEDKYYNKGEFIEVNSSDVKKIINKEESFILYVHNNFCAFAIPCENIFDEVIDKYKIDMLKINFDEFKNTSFYKKVEYAPSVIIVKDGKIIDYLDAEDDNDLEKYQDVNSFENWLKKYVKLKK